MSYIAGAVAVWYGRHPMAIMIIFRGGVAVVSPGVVPDAPTPPARPRYGVLIRPGAHAVRLPRAATPARPIAGPFLTRPAS